jgi:hypothetical protein
VFHHNSFQPSSFKPESWRFDLAVEPPVVRPDVIPYGSGRLVKPERKLPARRDTDDDVLMFLLR